MKKFCKRLLTIVMCVALVASFMTVAINASAASYTLKASVDSKEVEVNDQFDLYVNITENPGITMLRLTVEFDTSKLQLISAADEGKLGSYTFGDTKSSPYVLLWNNGTSDNFTFEGKIAKLTFKALSGLTDTASVTIKTTSANDILNKNLVTDKITLSATAGTVSLKACQHPSYTDTVVPPTPEADGYTRHQCNSCEYYYDDTPVDKLALKFKTASVSLDSALSMTFKADAKLFGTNGFTNPYVVFTLGGKTTTVTNYTVVNGLYFFELEAIAPNQANDKITAVLHASYNSKDYEATLEMSVADYCYKALAAYGPYDAYATLRTLLVDLLNYTSEVQTYSGHNVSNLANAKLTNTQKAWATSTAPTIGDIFNKNNVVNQNATVQIKGLGIVLEKSVTLRFKFLSESALTGGYVKFTTANGSSYVPFAKYEEIAKNTYYVYFDELNSAQMRDYVDITVYDANNVAISNTIRSSVESYVYRAAATEKTVTELMMKYGDSVAEYNKEFN